MSEGVDIKYEENKIVVDILEACRFEMLETVNNKKVIMIIIRLLKSLNNGRNIITHQKLAEMLGYENRQNISFHTEIFKNESNEDFGLFLERKIKYDKKIKDIVGTVVTGNYFCSKKEQINKIKERLNKENIELPNDAYLERMIKNCGGNICVRAQKDMQAGKIDYSENFVITELFKIVDYISFKKGNVDIDKNIIVKHIESRKTEIKIEEDIKQEQLKDTTYKRVVVRILWKINVGLDIICKWFVL